MTKEEQTIQSVNEDSNEDSNEDLNQDSSDEESLIDGGSNQEIPIDLSENEIYKGICTLLEDEDGNNILEYISLLHTELIGINKSLENLKSIKSDIRRIADCAELFVKSGSSDKIHLKEEVKKVAKKKEDRK